MQDDSQFVMLCHISYTWLFKVLIAAVCMECTIFYLEYKEHHCTKNMLQLVAVTGFLITMF
jgi:hypothetical protein